jgi:predicted ArsR family transcriptional regulator
MEADTMGLTVDQLPETRRSILLSVKRNGAQNAAELSAHLRISIEGIRQHLVSLEKDGLLERRMNRTTNPSGGRPTFQYALTSDGENLFPKHYDKLAIEIIDTVASELGTDALKNVLSQIVDKRVKEWQPKLVGLTFREKLEALKGLYRKDDPFMEIHEDDNGITLTEYNCPVLNIVQKHPLICSTTVTTLTRLLGVRVVREDKFQNGDGRCVFRIFPDEVINPDTVGLVVE